MNVSPVPVEDIAEPISELPVEEAKAIVLPQQVESDMELKSLDESFVIKRRSKKGKIIDQKITLSDKQLEKWRQNVNNHCRVGF